MTRRYWQGFQVVFLCTLAGLEIPRSALASPAVTYSVTNLGVYGSHYGLNSIDREAGLIRTADGSQSFAWISGPSGWTPMNEALPKDLPPSVSDPFRPSTPDTHIRGAWSSDLSPDVAVYVYDYSLMGSYRSSGTSIMAARRGEDGVWRNAETIAFAASPPNSFGNSIVGMNSRGQVLATANDGFDAWTGSYYTQSMHPSINLYDSTSGTLTRLADLFRGGRYFNVQPIALDDEGRVLIRADDPGSSLHTTYLLTPSYLPDAAPVPEPSTLIVLACGAFAFAHRRARRRA